jgi:nicotinamidase/pyrazinamidase
LIFFDIDTQRDFMVADGALYVPGAETIHERLGKMLRAAGEKGITTISTRCAHEPGDPEFELFPPHCLEGTTGAERLFAGLPELRRCEIAVEAPREDGAHVEPATHYVVKKKVFDLFSNRWIEGLRQEGAFRGKECIVFGVATDYCVRACVLGLAEAGARVRVVTDAIRGVAPDSTLQTMTDWESAGVELTTSNAILTEISSTEK